MFKTEELVINAGYGGYELSDTAVAWIAKHRTAPTLPIYPQNCFKEERVDPWTVAAVKALGNRASGPCASLVIQKAPQGFWSISEYDGNETLHFSGYTDDDNFSEWFVIHHPRWDDQTKVAILRHHYRWSGLVSDAAEKMMDTFTKENKEAVDEFHCIRLGTKLPKG